MDFKKNILTKALALICLTGWIFGFVLASLDTSGLGTALLYLWVILPASIVGLFQIIISARRWKKLTILDKVIFVIILAGLSFLYLCFLLRLLGVAVFK